VDAEVRRRLHVVREAALARVAERARPLRASSVRTFIVRIHTRSNNARN
jgi:hypothetical protein